MTVVIRVAMAMFGDGATSQGDFHEGLNFAAVMNARSIFFCQNNQYAISVPLSKQMKSKTIAQKAVAYDIHGVRVDGNDILAVYREVKEAAERARRGEGPTLIEAVTYRHSGHSRADPAKYRPEGELERWLQRDPVNLYRARLLEIGIAEGTLKDIEAEAMRKVDEATATAKASPVPALDAIERNVWANGGAAWRN